VQCLGRLANRPQILSSLICGRRGKPPPEFAERAQRRPAAVAKKPDDHADLGVLRCLTCLDDLVQAALESICQFLGHRDGRGGDPEFQPRDVFVSDVGSLGEFTLSEPAPLPSGTNLPAKGHTQRLLPHVDLPIRR